MNPWIQVDPRPLSWWVTELERMWGGHGEPREGNPSGLGLEGKKCVWEKYGEKEILVVLFGYIRLFFLGGMIWRGDISN